MIKVNSQEVRRYLWKWSTLENYVVQERAITDLYQSKYPRNSSLQDVLIKVSVLNDFYSTQILDTTSAARHIHKLEIDKRLRKADVTLVNEIANMRIGGKTRNNYSFASKYCSHHEPSVYPIYDSYVDKMLWDISKQDRYFEFKRKDLKTYSKFVLCIAKFQKYYSLDSFTVKEIDQYLWLLGKDRAGVL